MLSFANIACLFVTALCVLGLVAHAFLWGIGVASFSGALYWIFVILGANVMRGLVQAIGGGSESF